MKMLTATDSQTVSGFLQEEFTRVGKKTAESVIDEFRDRHYGREMRWRPPASHEPIDLRTAVEDATANKGHDATASFAETIVDAVSDSERIAHYELVAASNRPPTRSRTITERRSATPSARTPSRPSGSS